MNLVLFRGDNFLNKRTNPGLYRGNGLTSKAFGKSNPADIMKKGLLEAIRIHINPTGLERPLYDLTGYLSFSEDKNRAYSWAGGNISNMIAVGNDYTETRYIFTVTIPMLKLKKVADSIYEYRFPCNNKLVAGNSFDPYNMISIAVQNTVCHICHNVDDSHSILLVDTVSFLNRQKHIPNYTEAYDNSLRDREWLLWPNDPLGSQHSARIQRADFWSAEHYRLLTEPPRDPRYFSKIVNV